MRLKRKFKMIGVMEMSLDKTLDNIEQLRKQLVDLVQRKGLLDPEVVHLSQQLDSCLNHYHSLIREG